MLPSFLFQVFPILYRSFLDVGSVEMVTEPGLNLSMILSSIIFLLVFVAISFHLLHETAAALLGAMLIFLFTYIGGLFLPELSLLTFEEAMVFVDWNVIFLIMGMMIFVAVLADTNVFRWLAFRMIQGSKGRTWLLVAALITLTGVTSAFLNNVTAILLLAPLSIEVALALNIHPFSVVIPEVLASNIGGAITIIGDPPSTIVGSHLNLSFGEYFVNMAPITVLCLIILLFITRVMYRSELVKAKKIISPVLLNELAAESSIRDRPMLIKALIVTALTFVFFFLADFFNHMPPSVVALTGATLLIIWTRPDMNKMIREVDWTTLLFFIGIFISVGALEVTGVMDWVARQLSYLAGESVTRATWLVTWISGLVSGFVDNIPYSVAALPVVDYLTETIPGLISNHVLYWALILGADFGGNATYLGAATNIVAVGLLTQAGYRMSFGRFMRDGLPVTIVTLLVASLWLLLRYL